MTKIINGVEVDKLAEIIGVMKADPNRASVGVLAGLNGLTAHIPKRRLGILH